MSLFLDAIVELNGGITKGAKAAFARTAGVSIMTVVRWCEGKPIDERRRAHIAKAMGISPEQLDKISPPAVPVSNLSHASGTITNVPVVGIVSAEHFSCVFEENAPLEVLPMLTQRGDKGLMALKISGSCMEPTCSDGDYVVVSPVVQYEEGSLIVAKVNGDCTLKRIHIQGKTAVLKPDNKKFKEIRIPKEELNIVGVARYMMRKMNR